jgi:hypothetical protein
MNRQHQNEHGVLQRSPHVAQNFSAGAKFVLQWVKFALEVLLNTIRLVKDLGEVVSVLRFVSKFLYCNFRKHRAQADETLAFKA